LGSPEPAQRARAEGSEVDTPGSPVGMSRIPPPRRRRWSARPPAGPTGQWP